MVLLAFEVCRVHLLRTSPAWGAGDGTAPACFLFCGEEDARDHEGDTSPRPTLLVARVRLRPSVASADVSTSPGDTGLFRSWETSPRPTSEATGVVNLLLKQVDFCNTGVVNLLLKQVDFCNTGVANLLLKEVDFCNTGVANLLLKQVAVCKALQEGGIFICMAFEETKVSCSARDGYLSCRLDDALIRSG